MSESEGRVKEKESNVNILPEIPNGYIRLTHFTSEEVAKKFVEDAENFSCGKNGLSGTTDSFSVNQTILDLIKSKSIGPFERGNFGKAVILMDIEQNEYKKRFRPGSVYENEVPNHNILGYVLTEEKQLKLHRNPQYDPKENLLTAILPGPGKQENFKNGDVRNLEMSNISGVQSDEVW